MVDGRRGTKVSSLIENTLNQRVLALPVVLFGTAFVLIVKAIISRRGINYHGPQTSVIMTIITSIILYYLPPKKKNHILHLLHE